MISRMSLQPGQMDKIVLYLRSLVAEKPIFAFIISITLPVLIELPLFMCFQSF